MLYLFISIVCSVAVSVLLKIARSKGIVLAQAITVNYAVAALCVWYFLSPDLGVWADYAQHWWLFLSLGLVLPAGFVVMGLAVAQVGIVKSDAAQRLSVFLPILAAFALFGETLTADKIIGIALALLALLALLYKDGGNAGKKSKKTQSSMTAAVLLLGVWLCYGAVDILLKQVSKSGQAFGSTLLVTFILAGLLMLGYLLLKRTKWTAASVLGGLVLGGLNFANILFYIRAHQAYGNNPTLVFAGMNLGVITLGMLTGAVVFKEKISTINAAGIALALMAIVCLYYLSPIRLWLGV